MNGALDRLYRGILVILGVASDQDPSALRRSTALVSVASRRTARPSLGDPGQAEPGQWAVGSRR